MEQAGGKSLEGERIGFLVENGYDYIGMLALITILLILVYLIGLMLMICL